MKTKQPKLRFLLGLSLLLIAACSLMMSGMLAKYRTETAFANEVRYTNQLAESFRLLDKPMKQLEDGSYAVDTTSDAQPTSGFSFKLIPGITIPAEPYIEIKGKTQIPAYLYLEVENTSNVALTFDGKWSKLDGVSGKRGGDVYVYDNGAALIGDGSSDDTRTMRTFTIDKLTKYPDELNEGKIKVYAYMLQKVEDKSASDTYSGSPAV